MFTGIVREVGSVVAVTGGEEGMRLEIEAPATAPLVDVGGSVAINGVCLTAETRRRTTGSSSTPFPRRCRGRRSASSPAVPASTSSRRCGPATRWAGTSSRATSTGSAGCSRSRRRARGCASSSRPPPRRCATASRRARSRSTGVSLTIAELHDDAFGVALIPHTLAETTLARLVPGTARQPRGRRAREVRRAPARAATAASRKAERAPGVRCSG